MSDWSEKVKAARDMVSALCKTRGSKGSREWIMSIPARPDYDPDLVITSGLTAAEKRIKALESELAAANATLDALRDLCGPNRTISNSTCMKMVDILYPQEPRT